MSVTPVTNDWLLALPKVELHCHLDGSLRPSTVLELAREQNVDLGASSEAELRLRVQAGQIRTDLESYLVAFETTLSVMQTAPALQRVAYELVHDAAAENVVGLEIRFSPLLHQRDGLSFDEVVEAVWRGVCNATRETGTHAGLVLCGIRNMDPATTLAVADCAARFAGRGVVGIDLAGPEKGFPAAAHQAAFDEAHRARLGITVHAGEAEGAWAVRDAVEHQRATRVGHGTHAISDPSLIPLLVERQVTLEVCLKSNLETQSVASVADHPLRRLMALGVRVCLNTDNRLMSDERLVDEFGLAVNAFGLTRQELALLISHAIDACFLGDDAKADLRQRLAAFAAAHGDE